MPEIRFSEEGFAPVDACEGDALSEILTSVNSPVLFGCRTGICGTCLIEAEGDLPPAGPLESESLELYAPENPKARLACQLTACRDMRIKKLR